jgi:hypothetical protein
MTSSLTEVEKPVVYIVEHGQDGDKSMQTGMKRARLKRAKKFDWVMELQRSDTIKQVRLEASVFHASCGWSTVLWG